MANCYSHQQRFYLCACGEPVAAGIAGTYRSAPGGHFRCDHCGAERAMRRLADAPLGGDLPDRHDGEPERLARLRAQTGDTQAIPEAVTPLIEDSKVPERHLAEALATWHRLSGKLQAEPNTATEASLFWLTLFLANSFAEDEPQLRRRALLDGALDLLQAPERRQTLLCMLSDGAALERDFEAAAQWLARCNPTPEDLASDSTYRASTAMLSTVRGDYDKVLEVLGSTHAEVPIATSSTVMCAVLRANALEHLERQDGAIDELVACMDLGKPYHHAVTEWLRICSATYALDLCPTSYAAAESRYAMLTAIGAAREEEGCLGCVLIPLGIGFAAITLYGVVKLLLGDMDTGGNALIALPFAAICLVIGLLNRRASKRSDYLAAHGLPASAKVISVDPTGASRGGRSNRTPQHRITLEVQLEGEPPYEAEVKHYLDSKLAARIAVGTTFPVRAHPRDHSMVQIDLARLRTGGQRPEGRVPDA